MMKRLTLFIAAAALALLAACATGTPSVNSQLKAAYDTTNAYVEVTTSSLLRGRITVDQAAKASANAKKARDAIDTAAVALAGCRAPNPCTQYVTLMQGLQPALLEFERELRAQGAKQ